ncbi:hypothetical protein T484DRAFT_1877895, partial [Baffinella frigidus]
MMEQLGAAPVLRAVAAAALDRKVAGKACCTAALWVFEERHLAVLMGQHARIGANHSNWLMTLDAPVLWIIMQDASTVAVAADSLADVLTSPPSPSSSFSTSSFA